MYSQTAQASIRKGVQQESKFVFSYIYSRRVPKQMSKSGFLGHRRGQRVGGCRSRSKTFNA